MKKIYIIYLLGAIVTFLLIKGINILINGDKLAPFLSTQVFEEFAIGLFDHKEQVKQIDLTSFSHARIRLGQGFDKPQLKRLFSTAPANGICLVTVECPQAFQESINKSDLTNSCDKTVKDLCAFLSEIDKTIYLRFNPDMEVPVNLYAWQYKSPVVYINTFRHFSTLCKSLAKNIRIVWGTSGYPGVEEYWPGEDVVDLISITLDSKSELMTTAYPKEPSIAVMIKRKIQRMRFMDKPILVLGTERLRQNVSIRNQFEQAISKIKAEEKIIYSTLVDTNSINTSINRPSSIVKIGVYDPRLTLANLKQVSVEHIFVDLGNIQTGVFQKEFNAIVARKNDIIITVEPWRDKKNRPDSSALLNTVNGVYDEEFTQIYQLISNVKQIVYLRFAHEMEIPINRYPWQSKDPSLYIKAFRYFMGFTKSKPNNIKRVWGPAGDRGSMEWWPGSDVVDYISMAIYGLPDKNITDPTKQESFKTIYQRKYYRMRFAHKPIFITEFGVKGPKEFQQAWLKEAAQVINHHSEIAGVCYFNLADNPEVWGNIPAPNWGVSKTTFNYFIKLLGGSLPMMKSEKGAI
ncbi:hypothetical protein [Spirosoma litoris]